MLRQVKSISGYKLGARDGEIGTVKEFYFDDQSWAVRYLVADTGGWLSARQVLISPYALGPVSEREEMIPVDLTREQIENSPPLEADKPVSRQYELQYYPYYGWPAYWGGPYLWGADAYPEPGQAGWVERDRDAGADDPHLRSTRDLTGSNIQAKDGEIGHVEDFVIDDENWVVRYLIVDTRNWWPGKKVLISTTWIEGFSWEESKVFVGLTRETIKQAPEYSERTPITRSYEADLHRHYNRQGYWNDQVNRRSTQ